MTRWDDDIKLEQRARELYPNMLNRSMARKLTRGEAIDVSGCRRAGEFYVLGGFVDGKDYCDAMKERWIFSIGRHLQTGEILASTTAMFYQHKSYECLFLR
jgi:hypothetical protein